MNTTINIGTEIDLYTHLLVAGQAGSGKSVAMNGLILETIKQNNGAQLYLFDIKLVEFNRWRGVPGVEVCTTVESIAEKLKYLDAMMSIRYEVMSQSRSVKWAGSHIYIFIDELGDVILGDNKKLCKELQATITKIARMGRAAGIHLIVATQYPTKEVIPMQLKMNTDRLCLKCSSDIGYRVVMDEKIADLKGNGDAIYKDSSGNTIRFQVNYYSEELVEEFIQERL